MCWFLEIWEPQLLKPSGPVQACSGIALPLVTCQHCKLYVLRNIDMCLWLWNEPSISNLKISLSVATNKTMPDGAQKYSYAGCCLLLQECYVPWVWAIKWDCWSTSVFISAQYLPHRKRHAFITNTNQLFLFGKMLVVYSENYMNHVTTLCGKNLIVFWLLSIWCLW